MKWQRYTTTHYYQKIKHVHCHVTKGGLSGREWFVHLNNSETEYDPAFWCGSFSTAKKAMNYAEKESLAVGDNFEHTPHGGVQHVAPSLLHIPS
jgi:hypothetical protein